MRTAVFISSLLHAVSLALLAAFHLGHDLVEVTVARGQPIQLQVSKASEHVETTVKMTTEESPAEAEPEPRPVEIVKRHAVLVPDAPAAEVAERAAEASAPQTTAKRTTPVESPSLDSLDSQPLARRSPPAALVAEASVPLEITVAELGVQVDELPRKLAANPAPPYPADALSRRVEGRVVLLVRVAADGTVEEAKVQASSGHAGLDASALSTVKGWKFAPARRSGVAVAYEVLVPVNFSIRS